MEGSWDLAKFSVSRIVPKKPATREIGSKMVKTKRGIGGRTDVMFAIVLLRARKDNWSTD
jgi:hypothetical protein